MLFDWVAELEHTSLRCDGGVALRCDFPGKYEWSLKVWKDLVYQTHPLRLRRLRLVDFFVTGPFECECGYARISCSLGSLEGYRLYSLQSVGLRGHVWLGASIQNFAH